MLPLRKWRLFLFVLAVACVVPSHSAVVVETRDYHGKSVSCWQYGNRFSPIRECGTQGYVRVFTGTVESAVDITDTEKRLVLIPDEVFLGDPVSEVTAIVDQACLPKNEPEIQTGDVWLFYLQTNQSFQMDGNPPYSTRDLVLPSYGPSKPLSEAEDDIATLRHLAGLTDTAILAGNVERIGATYDHLDPTPVPNRKIIAKGVSGIEYVAFTNSNGHFEFDLPPDTYDVTADAEPGLREAERSFPRGSTHLEKQACLDVDFTMLRDGKLAGQVRTSRGKPARFVKVAIIPIAPVHPQFAVVTDEQGHFEVGGRQPGSYLVGVGLLAQIGSPEWQSRVYFPGVPTREQAKVIELGDGEWRTDIDFELPRSKTR